MNIFGRITTVSGKRSGIFEKIKKCDLKFVLNGTYLKGAFALVRMNDGTNKNWLLIKKNDEFDLPEFKIEELPPIKSKHKKKVKNEPVLKKKVKLPKAESHIANHTVEPMLAKLNTQIIDKKEWNYELKYDGYRVISIIDNSKSGSKVGLISRNGNSFTELFVPITKELIKVDDAVILDGEVVIENNKGISDFQLLQNYSTTKKGILKYYVFDILFLNGQWIDKLPLIQRKELLEVFFEKYTLRHIHLTTFQTGNGKSLYEKYEAKGFEGIIAKNPESTYQMGKRSESWLKVKTNQSTEAIICGYTLPQNSRKHFGSIILGMYENGNLKYIGNCGSGFTEASLKELYSSFKDLATEECPFIPTPKMSGIKGKPVWIHPELVCNVKFAGWTNENRLRNPVFMGIRIDKEVNEVIDESENTLENQKIMNKRSSSIAEKDGLMKLSGHEVKVTNLTKVYWPDEGYTKGDLIAYYNSVSKYILPYLKDRPQSLNRFPNGISGGSFYQKDMDVTQLPSWVKTEKIYSKSNNEYIDYLICNDAATLIYMANLGCIEINPWHSTYLNPDNPTYMMLDLDPGDISFLDVVDTAVVIKEICDQIKVPCYCKTSGATGLHIYIPLGGKYTYDEVKTFGELMAYLTHKKLPETTSIERRVANRKDKIYVDFLQNRKGQTIVAPYSVRPRSNATVSAPLLWEEVNHSLKPEQFTILNMEKRLEKVGDLWKPVLKKGIYLEKVLKQIDKL